MNLFLYIGLTLLVIGAGLSVVLFNLGNSRYLKLLLAFSGAYLFAISVLHLLPEVYEQAGMRAGTFILVGFFIQLLLEFFSKGIEHGHIHVHGHNATAFPLAILTSLCLHSFFEGMPITEGHSHGLHEGHDHSNSLIFGIILHKVPVAVVLVVLLLQSGVSKVKTIGWLLFFAAMMPLGTIVNHFVGESLAAQVSDYSTIVLGVVIGILLHVSTTILFETSENHRFNTAKFVSIIVGVALAFFSI